MIKKRYRPTRIITPGKISDLLPCFLESEFKPAANESVPMYLVYNLWKSWTDKQGYQRITKHELWLAFYTNGYAVTENYQHLLGYRR